MRLCPFSRFPILSDKILSAFSLPPLSFPESSADRMNKCHTAPLIPAFPLDPITPQPWITYLSADGSILVLNQELGVFFI